MTKSDRSAGIEPFSTMMLEVGDGHNLYVERVGKPNGIPAIYLHGGPGSGFQPQHRELFDATRYCAVLFDQRGAGRSRPPLSLEANTTQHLVADIEKVRLAVGFERMLVVGGSWGSTLALAYAERYPERVLGIALRAIFLGTRVEVEWAFLEGPRRFRPDLYRQFLAYLPEAERTDPLAAYYRRLTSPDPAIQVPAAWIFFYYERALSELVPGTRALPQEPRTSGRPPSTAVIEAHYLAHDCFLEPDELIRNAGRLSGIPGVIVQSRYDMLCPPDAAYQLNAAWPGSELVMIEAAGHAMSDPGVWSALIAGLEQIANGLSS